MDELALRQALKQLVTLYEGEQAALAALTVLDENGVSPSSLFEMEYRDIREMTGLSAETSRIIGMVDELARYTGVEELGASPCLDTLRARGEFFQALTLGRREEYCYLASLSPRGHLRHLALLSRGTLDSSTVYMRDVARQALNGGENQTVMAHNHPSGSMNPSRSDVELTRTAREVLGGLGIELLEHVIVTPGGYTGIIEGGWL
ncbi:MAG: JAB domain-containing protein [Clostridiales bacterium]|nr:JAB domain-containing protein [Clostridiales bacterium]